MDIQAIQDAIDILEKSATTMENVDELSKLYIVRDNLVRSAGKSNSRPKILAGYDRYIEIKRQYQMRQIPEDAVILSAKELYQEIEELISLLYSNSDLRKERKYLKECITKISDICSN